MKLLIVTQKVNEDDPILSFFHSWIVEFAKRFESITVICLEKGRAHLPENVKVLSLGKEKKHSRIRYITRFFRYIWSERKNYDAVFVHMNQEYVLLGGLFWRLMGKKTYMWRNHHAGSWLTDLAASMCKKVFCTSKFSYTAKYKKTVIMPVGIDTEVFKKITNTVRVPRSILFLGRMSPVKKPDLLIRVLLQMRKQNIDFTATFCGNPLPSDQKYYDSLQASVREAAMTHVIKFLPGIPNSETVTLYNRHEVFVNLSSSGMYDKTIFEAMACECLVLASNNNLHGLIDERYIFEENNLEELSTKLSDLLQLKNEEQCNFTSELREVVVSQHSLSRLSENLKDIIK